MNWENKIRNQHQDKMQRDLTDLEKSLKILEFTGTDANSLDEVSRQFKNVSATQKINSRQKWNGTEKFEAQNFDNRNNTSREREDREARLAEERRRNEKRMEDQRKQQKLYDEQRRQSKLRKQKQDSERREESNREEDKRIDLNRTGQEHHRGLSQEGRQADQRTPLKSDSRLEEKASPKESPEFGKHKSNSARKQPKDKEIINEDIGNIFNKDDRVMSPKFAQRQDQQDYLYGQDRREKESSFQNKKHSSSPKLHSKKSPFQEHPVAERGGNDKKYRKNHKVNDASTNANVLSRANEDDDSLDRDLDELDPSDEAGKRDAMADGSKLKSSKRLQALKLTDIYKSLQAQRPIQKEYDTSDEESDSESGRFDNSRRAFFTPGGGSNHQAKILEDCILIDDDELVEQQLEDIVESSLIHVLSAFAIAEDKQDIFLRIKAFLKYKNYELPAKNGIYERSTWKDIRKCRSRFVHQLFSQALQMAIQMDWFLMCQTILIHSQWQKFLLVVTTECLTTMLSNESYDSMNMMINYGVYFTMIESTTTEYKLALRQDDSESAMRNTKRSFHGTSPRKDSLVKKLSLKRQATDRSMLDSQKSGLETGFFNAFSRVLSQGQQLLQAQHFINQLLVDKPNLTKLTVEHKEKKELRTVLQRLSESEHFVRVIPVLVLKGNRDVAYELIQTKNHSFQIDSALQKDIGLEFFCFSVSQEHLDDAINIFNKFPTYFTKHHRTKCVTELLGGIKRSAAFIEFKFYLLQRFLSSMSKEQVLDFLDIAEIRLLAPYKYESEHRSVLLQNLNSLKTTLQTLYTLKQIEILLPTESDRIRVLSQDLESNQASILENIVYSDYDQFISSCYRSDLLGHNVFFYLSDLKPEKILNTHVIQKIVNNYWKSSFFTSKGSLFYQSSCYQIIFADKLKTISLTTLLCGKGQDPGAIQSASFLVWKKSIRLRWVIELLFNLSIYAFLQWLLVFYMREDFFLDDTDYLAQLAIKATGHTGVEQVQNLDHIGTFIACTYCELISFLMVFAFSCNAILKKLFVEKTGQECPKKSLMSKVQVFAIIAYLGFSGFYFTMVFKESFQQQRRNLERPHNWEETENGSHTWASRFGENINIWQYDDSKVVSERFWAGLMMFSLWMHFLHQLNLGNLYGPTMAIVNEVVASLFKYFTLWVLSLLLFAGIAIIWLGDDPNYESLNLAISSLLFTSVGMQDTPDTSTNMKPGIFLLHALFLLVNVIGFVNFFTAVMTDVLIQLRDQGRSTAIYYGHMFDQIPVLRYQKVYGWMSTAPTILSPFLLLIVYPVFYLLNRYKNNAGEKVNTLICCILYVPICALQLLPFTLLNLIMIPVAYISGVYQLIQVNPYHEGKTHQAKWYNVAVFLIFGVPILVIAQLPDAFYCVYALYVPSLGRSRKKTLGNDEQIRRDFLDALEYENERQSAVNICNIQRLYKVISKQISYQIQNEQEGFESDHVSGKNILEELRKNMGIQNCIKMMFFGTIPGFVKGSGTFMSILESEGQTIENRLNAYNIFKKVILGMGDEQFHGPTRKWQVRSGLLFQYIQEIKMRIVAVQCLERHSQGEDLIQVDFMKLSRSTLRDEFAREFLIACPSAVLEVLTKESRGQNDKLLQAVADMETRLVDLIKLSAVAAGGSELGEPPAKNQHHNLNSYHAGIAKFEFLYLQDPPVPKHMVKIANLGRSDFIKSSTPRGIASKSPTIKAGFLRKGTLSPQALRQ